MKTKKLISYFLVFVAVLNMLTMQTVASAVAERSYINDSFDNVTAAELKAIWVADKTAVGLTTGYTGYGMKISSSATADNAAVRSQTISLSGEIVTLSMNVSTTANFEVGMKNSANERIKLLAINKSDKSVKYFTGDTQASVLPETNCNYQENTNGWETIRIIFNKDAKTVEVNTQNGGFIIENYELPESLNGFFVSAKKALGRAVIIDNFCVKSSEAKEQIYINDGFDTVTAEALKEQWIADKTAVGLTMGYTGYGMKISSSATADNVAVRSQTISLSGKRVVLSMNVSATANFEIGIKNSVDEHIKLLAVNKSDKSIRYFTSDTQAEATPATYCIYQENANGWETIRIIFDKAAKTVEVNTQNGGFIIENYELPENLNGFFISVKKALGRTVIIDDFYVRNESKKSGFSIDYSQSDTAHKNAITNTAAVGENGLLKLSATYQNSEAVTCTNPIKGCVNVNIDCGAEPLDKNQNFHLVIEYKDQGYGWFYVTYPGIEKTEQSEYFSLTNSGVLLTKEIILSNAAFGDGDTGYDFQICTTTETSTYNGYSDKKTSMDPVYIKSVRGYMTNDYSPVRITVTTNHTGNIFYEADDAEFNAELKNKTADVADIKAKYDVYIINDEIQEVFVDSITKKYTIGANKTFKDKVTVPAAAFGVYVLKITLSGTNAEKNVSQNKRVSFSRSVKNEAVDYRLGVNTSFSRATVGGDPDLGMQIMRNAGIGMVREDFEWGNYEHAVGEYSLIPEKTAFLEAAGRNDMEVLAILDGGNRLYNDWNTLVPPEDIEQYQNHVKAMLSEQVFLDNVSMLEVWNEPDGEPYLGDKETLIFDGSKDNNAEYNKKRGYAYSELVKAVYNAAEEVKSEKGKDYEIGIFSLCKFSDNSAGFVDEALKNFEGKQYFDTLTFHPYVGPVDPEPGSFGKDTAYPTHYASYILNFYRSLITGEELYNPVTKKHEVFTGINTGTHYAYKFNSPVWLTETGYSSANNSEWGMALKTEYCQGERIIRMLNEIRTNSYEDKTWIYRFEDNGIGEMQTESNWGIVNSYTNEVPYSAKPAYLMLANMNKLICGYTAVERVYEKDYAFVSKYTTPERNVYILSSTKEVNGVSSGRSVDDFHLDGEVWYYDLYGNQLDESEVLVDGKYQLTTKPFYAVTGKDIEGSAPVAENIEIHLVGDTGRVDDKTVTELITDGFGVELMFESFAEKKEYILACAVYNGGRLEKVKYASDKLIPEGAVSYKSYDNLFEAGEIKDADEIKIFLLEDMKALVPILSVCIKNDKE